MKADVVIGANYGDEGKGLITDYLAARENSNTVVVRFNGGAQAGHTVQLQNGKRHVFSHFSSGTFAGAQTYLSEFFIANPILFSKEMLKLKALGYCPKVIIHPRAFVTTPYDMFINQLVENSRGIKRHGSCGVGVGETIERNLHDKFQLKVNNLLDTTSIKKKLLSIRDEWLELRLVQLIGRKLTPDEKALICSKEIFEHFLSDIQVFRDYCEMANYNYLENGSKLIFEGAQGLLLDQNHKNFPHVTRSNTGLQNVSTIVNQLKITHLDIHYVTRCYLTRHGAGPLPNEYSVFPSPLFKDDTNRPHKFQGSLRFAPLNLYNLNMETNSDLKKLSKQISKKTILAVTCLDQFQQKIALAQKSGRVLEFEKNDYLNVLMERTQFNGYVFNYSPTRGSCKSP